MASRKNLQKIIDDYKVDVIHAHLRRATKAVAKADTNAVKISTLHIGVNHESFLKMDALIAISPWQMEHVPKEYAGILKWIRNSLSPHTQPSRESTEKLKAELGIGQNEFVIGGVGRLTKGKGWGTLIEAFRLSKLQNARLVLIGEGRDAKTFKKLAKSLNISILSYKKNIKDYYPVFDIFVCPSHHEPMGRVILEAMDSELPVVASNVEGPKDILSEFPGTLFPAGDAASLSRALTQHYASFVSNGSQKTPVRVNLSAHYVENVNHAMVELYNEALLAREK